jgi:hypothetical protein
MRLEVGRWDVRSEGRELGGTRLTKSSARNSICIWGTEEMGMGTWTMLWRLGWKMRCIRLQRDVTRGTKRARGCCWEYVKRDDEVLCRQIAGNVVVWLLMLDEGWYRDTQWTGYGGVDCVAVLGLRT